MKKKYVVERIKILKGKLVVEKDIQHLHSQISKLSGNGDRFVTANEKLCSELLIFGNISNNYNNAEISGILNEISDEALLSKGNQIL